MHICAIFNMNIEKKKILTKISRLYYLDDLSQQEIADRLGISRSKVSRSLTQARNEKIVEIKINSIWERYEEIEASLEKAYGLKQCKVVSSNSNADDTYMVLAHEMGNILERLLEDGWYVGIGWGLTLRTIADHLDINRKKNIKVVPMIGGLGKVGTGVHTNSVAKTIADKFGGVSFVIHSPAVLDSKEIKEVIERDSNTSEIIKLADKVDVALLGISDIGPDSTLIKTGNFSIGDFNYLKSLGVVGDLNLIFIDSIGREVKSGLDERIVRASYEKVKAIENTIVAGFGNRKVDVIAGALRGDLVDILLTDEETATGLLERSREV